LSKGVQQDNITKRSFRAAVGSGVYQNLYNRLYNILEKFYNSNYLYRISKEFYSLRIKIINLIGITYYKILVITKFYCAVKQEIFLFQMDFITNKL